MGAPTELIYSAKRKSNTFPNYATNNLNTIPKQFILYFDILSVSSKIVAQVA